MSKVFLAVPHYGAIEGEALPDLIAPSLRIHDVSIRAQPASLLGYNFNCLWCTALNGRKTEGYTKFAMHHADIASEIGWLDKLIAEQERVGADVLSTVVAIKDPRGLTTTGIMDAGKPNVRRLTMTEIMKLPVTFSAEDVEPGAGKHLAINTGLWVCDFTKPWVEEAVFTIIDWISKDDAGNFKPNVLSEDWFFSHWCQTHGVKVFATRIVPADHKGHLLYSNRYAWGDLETDKADPNPSLPNAQTAA